ncbi:hypothetical protein [Microbacterium lacus]|uniref:hypothetical protein n=1 Tax=Microbacterium lacus TaxID=415217 RepID=UPI000C2C9B18|nr:hypothetical protein [Microbacterium lacus]
MEGALQALQLSPGVCSPRLRACFLPCQFVEVDRQVDLREQSVALLLLVEVQERDGVEDETAGEFGDDLGGAAVLGAV